MRIFLVQAEGMSAGDYLGLYLMRKELSSTVGGTISWAGDPELTEEEGR